MRSVACGGCWPDGGGEVETRRDASGRYASRKASMIPSRLRSVLPRTTLRAQVRSGTCPIIVFNLLGGINSRLAPTAISPPGPARRTIEDHPGDDGWRGARRGHKALAQCAFLTLLFAFPMNSRRPKGFGKYRRADGAHAHPAPLAIRLLNEFRDGEGGKQPEHVNPVAGCPH